MIEVKNINKFFNKNKSNQIHVINDTSLTFPKTGLVCLLGPSGSGKTTLLNVIGGLDKVDSGEIIFNEISIKKYHANKWDMIRNSHFGYIFQNYVLLPDLTVYQNLEFVLKMLNVESKDIETRINYALNAVGMIKYKKRKPSQLSGGQQQRVAIARALVKSPDVVIADEPTGNLDEKNTTQIMNIIKKISKECLVVLVTHERRLADFYADQIIELKDGNIISQNDIITRGNFQNLYDNNIYLKDLEKEEINSEDINVKYFYADNKPKLDINIIFKDNTFYINSPMDNVKIKFIDGANEIKIIDSNKPIINHDEIEKFDYSLPKLSTYHNPKSAISFKDTMKMSFSHLFGLKRRQKLMFLILFLSTIMVTIGFINYFSASYVDDSTFISDNRNLLDLTLKEEMSYTDYKNLISKYDNEIILLKSSTLSINTFINDMFEQTVYAVNFSRSSLFPIDLIENPKILYGKLPTKVGEIALDKTIVEREMNQFRGFKYLEQFVGLTYNNDFIQGKIVGIIDNNNPNIYVTKEEYYLTALNQHAFREYSFINQKSINSTNYFTYDDYMNNKFDSPKLFSELTLGKYDVVIPQTLINSHFIDSNVIQFDNLNLNIIGVCREDYYTIISDEIIEELYYESVIKQVAITSIYTYDKETVKSELEALGYDVHDRYQEEYDRIASYKYNYGMYITSLMILISSLLFLYFLMRSSLISRIYEVGVYRALGVKKSNIYKLFFTEIVIITLLTSLTAIFTVSYIVNRANQQYELVYYPWYISVLSFGFVFLCNTLVGLLPVYNLLRNTPSQILSKYDI